MKQILIQLLSVMKKHSESVADSDSFKCGRALMKVMQLFLLPLKALITKNSLICATRMEKSVISKEVYRGFLMRCICCFGVSPVLPLIVATRMEKSVISEEVCRGIIMRCVCFFRVTRVIYFL